MKIRNFSDDIALARFPRPLIKRIENEGKLACDVKHWVGSWEVEEIMNGI